MVFTFYLIWSPVISILLNLLYTIVISFASTHFYIRVQQLLHQVPNTYKAIWTHDYGIPSFAVQFPTCKDEIL